MTVEKAVFVLKQILLASKFGSCVLVSKGGGCSCKCAIGTILDLQNCRKCARSRFS